MTSNRFEKHRRHMAAFLATGAFVTLASGVSSAPQYKAYLTPEEAGFLSKPSPDRAMHKIVCRDSISGEVVESFDVASATTETSTDPVEVAKEKIRLLEELTAMIEADEASNVDGESMRASAPDQESTGFVRSVMGELGRWFGV